VLAAVLSNNRLLTESISNALQQSGNPLARCFESPVDLIRHMLHREAIDVVVIDADTHIGAVARLSAWRSSQGRKDFAILSITQTLQPEVMSRALELGSDDVVAGVFNRNEFVGRASRCLVRLAANARQMRRIELGGYVLEKDNRRVMLNDVVLPLREHEFGLSWLFFSNPGILISRPRIAAEVWNKSVAEIGNALGKHIHKLRSRLQIGAASPVALRAVYSSGYRLEVVEDTSGAAANQRSSVSTCFGQP
jgi:DNA-binding response OmpR family regulator